ncbi:sensor histidine kinase [Sphingobacterium spiritivorum]|uniref:sensor histidine kinase n=2 Tax=Sphingobacterium spiritivorum TaxID=258 RepID=UPI003DA4DE82
MRYRSQKMTENQIINFIVDKRYKVWRHITLLLTLFLHLYYSTSIDAVNSDINYPGLIAVFITFTIMFYINIYILVPTFFLKAEYALYFLFLVILVVAGLTSLVFTFTNYIKPEVNIKEKLDMNRFYNGAVLSIIIILISTLIKLMQRWVKDNERIAALSNLTLSMELNELKNQINPHFLFNMLNNIKALTRSNPEAASVVIMKLSEFLRYQLYENNEDKTLLVSEINFLSNFVNLEKIRRDSLSITIQNDVDPKILNSIFIPPNLFTTFVENAVKHSVSVEDTDAYIRIQITLENGRLQFNCKNSKTADYHNPDKKNSGLGLNNIKRRLKLLYDRQYQLDISSSDREYIVNLSIPV